VRAADRGQDQGQEENQGKNQDKLWGLSWRVADIDATRERLIAAGIEASEVRVGRKPGTRVMSLRSGTCGIHTLLLERTPKAGI